MVPRLIAYGRPGSTPWHCIGPAVTSDVLICLQGIAGTLLTETIIGHAVL